MTKQPDDEYNYEIKSIGEVLMKYLWILIGFCMWVGVILSIFTGSSALQILGGVIIASAFSGFLYYVAYYKGGVS
jgi:hypothetical protein